MPFFADQLAPKQRLREGDSAHFECRVVPPNVQQVEWLHNGQQLANGHRYRTMYDFGFISLDILYVYPEDAGTYTCRARNDTGAQCETSGQLCVEARQTIIHEAQCPGGMERLQVDAAGLEHQNYVYQSGRSDGFTDTNGRAAGREGAGAPPIEPQVTMPLMGTQRVLEGDGAHLECRIEPVNDARIRVEFLHNGRPLVAGSRYHTVADFGYVSLDISHTKLDDSGLYTVRAHNPALGGAGCETSLRMSIVPVSGVQTQTLHMGALAKLQQLELSDQGKRYDDDDQLDDQLDQYGQHRTFQRPLFRKPVTPSEREANERDTVDYHCLLIPVADSSLKVEWFHNGRPLEAGSRFKMVHEFGLVSLRIERLQREDTGIYQCRATNRLGEALTTGKLRVRADELVQTETLNPDTLDRIRLLEAPKDTSRPEEAEPERPAKIVRHLMPGARSKAAAAAAAVVGVPQLKRNEGESVHLYCQLEPADATVEWLLAGRPLVTGSRVHTTEDFGYAHLDIDYLYGRDSGEYVCRVSNPYGRDETRVRLAVRSDKSIVTESQLATPLSTDRLRQLECPDVPEERELVEAVQGARFVRRLKQPEPNWLLEEGALVVLECQVEPKDDPHLQVEWYFNEKPLIQGHRHRVQRQFGLCRLEIHQVYQEDGGTYKCLATNKTGQDATEANFRVGGHTSLVVESQLPESMRHGYKRLQQLEEAWNDPQQLHKQQAQQEEKERLEAARKHSPEFVLKPKPVQAFENSCARFCCRISANPPARLTWLVNGELAVTSSRFKVFYDGMHHLEIPRCRLVDAGPVQVHARNALGECLCTTELRVQPRVSGDYRSQLKNSPKVWYDEHALKTYQLERPSSSNSTGSSPATSSPTHSEASAALKLGPGLGLSHGPAPPVSDNGPPATGVPEGSPRAEAMQTGTNEAQTENGKLEEVSVAPAEAIPPAPARPKQSFGMAPAPSTIKRALFLKNKGLSLTPPPESPPPKGDQKEGGATDKTNGTATGTGTNTDQATGGKDTPKAKGEGKTKSKTKTKKADATNGNAGEKTKAPKKEKKSVGATKMKP